VFIFALLFILMAALKTRSYLPASMVTVSGDSHDDPPFIIVLFIILGILVLCQILSNRSLLERAHKKETDCNQGNFL
jgi:di/tricarboxylate transporter